ncbi:OsmC family protein [Frigidibacter oleivorans]|uniref:OsmC family protein n=1 Tax=Frigidibacter oleivorans TaxID=2487129 RepID=UPI00197AD76B|nr:OsmC family protein [Frigidibacter oleivorans]
MITKSGSAEWTGGLKDGKGSISTESGVLDSAPYGFAKRFGDEAGTNPEELIGAAHAACFSMALSNILGGEGITPDRIETTSKVSLEQKDGGFAITKIHLVTQIVADAPEDKLMESAEKAKANCPVSKVLAGAEITMEATVG